MEAHLAADGKVTLTMTLDEAIVLHAQIAFSEFAEELRLIELPEDVHQVVFSDVQQSLAPVIPSLGTEAYGPALTGAERRLADVKKLYPNATN